MKRTTAPGLCRHIGRRLLTVRTALPVFLALAFSIISSPLSTVKAQGEADNWYFGSHAGIKFLRDANGSLTGTIAAQMNGALNTFEGCASISDRHGNLLFYTDGMKVYNRNHQQMPNGTGLKGNSSASQSGIIVPKPGSSTNFYIFTVPVDKDQNGGVAEAMYYSEVDMTLAGGKGDVLTNKKNIQLLGNSSEKVAVVPHANGFYYWVIGHNYFSAAGGDRYYAYLIDCNGVSTTPNISKFGMKPGSALGYLVGSPNGSMIAAAYWGDRKVELLDFDNSMGTFSNLRTLSIPSGTVYGVAFSPDNSKLYASDIDRWAGAADAGIHQWNLSASDIQASRQKVGNFLATPGPSLDGNAIPYRGGALQLGPNGRIYVANDGQEYLGVIRFPNTMGAGCDYVQNVVNLGGGGKKSGLGLPPFISSFFAPQKRIQVTGTPNPAGLPLQFNLLGLGNHSIYTSIEWDFGDGSPTVNQVGPIGPTHTYSGDGVYKVTVTVKGGPICSAYGETYEYRLVSGTGGLTFFPDEPVVCPGDLIELKAAGGDNMPYRWYDSAGNLLYTGDAFTVVPTANTTYTVKTLVRSGANLVRNGDFELGNTSFESDYVYVPSASFSEQGHYSIRNDPSTVNSGFSNCNDKVPGTATGKMLVADGACSSYGVPANAVVWRQKIKVTPNTSYAFSAWLTNVFEVENSSTLTFYIDGIKVGEPVATNTALCSWTEYHALWTSAPGSPYEITIDLREGTGTCWGNDFAVDGISFMKYDELSKDITVKVNGVTNPSISTTTDIVCGKGNRPDVITGSDSEASKAPGADITYQWQHFINWEWCDITDSTRRDYHPSVPTGSSEINMLYRRITTSTLDGKLCEKISNEIPIRSHWLNSGSIEADHAVCEGEKPVRLENVHHGFSVWASNAPLDYEPQYRWEYMTYDPVAGVWPATWTVIPGATGADYEPTSSITEQTKFRRVAYEVADGGEICEHNSDDPLLVPVTVTVKKTAPPSLVDGDEVRDCSGMANRTVGDFLMNGVVYGDGIKWYDAQTGGNPLPDTHILQNGHTYWASQEPAGQCESYVRRAVTYKADIVVSPGVIEIDGTSSTFCHPEKMPPMLKSQSGGSGGVNVTGATLSYKWKIRTANLSTKADLGETGEEDLGYSVDSDQLQPQAHMDAKYLVNGRQNRFVRYARHTLHNGEVCERPTDYRAITINHVDGGTIDGDQAVCEAGSLATITALGSVDPGQASTNPDTPPFTYRWVYSRDGWATETQIDNASAASYTPDRLHKDVNGHDVFNSSGADAIAFRRVTVSDMSGECKAKSNPVTVTVKAYKTMDGGVLTCGVFAQKEVKDLGDVPNSTANKKAEAGEELLYTITVKNDWNHTVHNVDVSDVFPEGVFQNSDLSSDVDNALWAYGNDGLKTKVTYTIPIINSKDTKTITLKVQTKQNLTGVEWIENTVEVKGDVTNYAGDVDEAKATIKTNRYAKIKAEKSADLIKAAGNTEAGKAETGDEIDYVIKLTNTGDVNVDNVSAEDEIPAGTKYEDNSASHNGSHDNGTPGKLTWTGISVPQGNAANPVELTFRVKVLEDLTLYEWIKNTADVNATVLTSDAENGNIIKEAAKAVDLQTVREGKLEVEKKVVGTVPANGYQLDEEINYEITVKNTGNVTLYNVSVTDALADAITGNGGATNPIATLGVGEVKTFTAVHKVKQADVDAGRVDNIATVAGSDPDNTPVTAASTDPAPDPCTDCPPQDVPCTSCTTVPVFRPEASVTITKEQIPAGKTDYEENDPIEYRITVTNTGKLTLTNLEVTDDNADDNPAEGAPLWKFASLAPDGIWAFSVHHTVTQGDLDLGKVLNRAKVTADTPWGKNITPEDESDQVTVKLDQKPGLELKKEIVNDQSPYDKDDANPAKNTVTYRITVTNTGNVTLDNITVTDHKADQGAGSEGKLPGGLFSLSPQDAPKVFTVTHKITQADVDAGEVANQADARGQAPDGNPVDALPATATASVLQGDPKLEITKKVTSKGAEPADYKYKLGETVEYAITVKNTGALTLHSIGLTDINADAPGLAGGGPNPIPQLEVGEVKTFTAKHTVTQADVDAGRVDNIVIAGGTSPHLDPLKKQVTAESTDPDKNENRCAGCPGGNPTDGRTTVPVDQGGKGSLKVLKEAVSSGPYSAGDKIEYRITVENTGTLTLKNVSVTDPNADPVPGVVGNPGPNPIPTLAVGEVRAFTAWHTVTQPDLDAGHVDNLASTKGKDPQNGDVTADSEDPKCPDCPKTTVPVTDPDPKVEMKKAVVNKASMPFKLGDQIRYEITVKNSGNVVLTNVEVKDNNADSAPVGKNGGPNPIPVLMPGAELVFTAEHTVTAADVATGHVNNLASTKGKDPAGKDVTADSTDPDCPDCPETTIPIGTPNPELELLKAVVSSPADPAKGYVLGESIRYEITVRNTGNVAITGLEVKDDKADPVPGLVGKNGEANPIAVLMPGESAVFTAEHKVAQADVDAGRVDNLASAEGKDPGKNAVTADSTDPAPDPCTDCPPPADPCASCTTVPVDQGGKGSLKVLKEAVSSGPYSAGDKIEYRITVENTGTLTLKNVAVTDPNADPIPGVVGKNGGPNPIPTLAVGEGREFTAWHTVTAADIALGYVDNLAGVRGKDPQNGDVTKDSEAPDCPDCPNTTVPVTNPEGKMDVEKKVTNKADMPFGQGDKIQYEITVRNTGNVVLTDIDVSDGNADARPVGKNGEANPIPLLMPGAELVFTAEHTVTAADVAIGYVNNLATAEGKDPAGGDVTADSTDPDCPDCPDTSVPIGTPNPEMAVDKAVVNKTDMPFKLGDKIKYAITVRNTGNVVLTNVDVTDSNADAKPERKDGGPNPIPALMPGKALVFTAEHTVTAADATTGYVNNLASTKGKDPQGGDVTADSTDPDCPDCPDTSVPIGTPEPDMEMTKAVVNKGDMPFKQGDKIRYEITVRNTGNVVLTDIDVSDNNADAKPVGKDGEPNPIPALLPGKALVFTAEHTVTAADVAIGYVNNLATAEGKDPAGGDVTADSTDPDCPDCPDTSVPIGTPNPEMAVDKAVVNKTDMPFKLGDKIKYEITVRNTGNTVLTDIDVSDSNADAKPERKDGGPNPIPALMPGMELVFTAEHTVTAADATTGYVNNLASTKGKDPQGGDVTADSTDPDCPDCPDTSVPIGTPEPDMEMTKAVVNKGDMPFKQGDKIRYEITVRNTGNVVLTDIDVSDNNADAKPVGKDGEPNPIPALLPGKALVFTAEHTVTAADVAIGYVNNLATAEGKDPAGGDVTADSTDPDCPDCPDTSVPIGTPNPEMAVDKAVVGQPADPALGYQLGDRIEYAITVRNTGNVVLKDIELTDAKADEENGAPWERTVDLLMPGKASDVFTAYHTITQADADAGGVLNIALAKGKDPQNGDVTAESTDPNCGTPPCTGTAIDIPQHPGMSVTKSADWERTYLLGDVIAYDIVIANTGNVTLTNVEVRDDNAVVSSTGVDEDGKSVPNPVPVLEVGRSVRFTAAHEVTQDDIDAKYVRNLAVATGKDPDGKEVSEASVPPDGYGDPEDPEHSGGSDSTAIRVGIIPIVAEDDHYPVWTGQGTATGSVLSNDTFDGRPAGRSGRVELLPGTPDDPALMRMDPADGSVSVRPGLRPGRHAYPYTIRQADYPKNLSQAVAYIDVVDPKRGLYIPNVFTPNGDGVNDTFEILGLEGHGIERISLIVADRAGRPLYENEDYCNEWDADGIPDGTYFYRIEAHGGTIGTKVFKGWVTVMRRDWK